MPEKPEAALDLQRWLTVAAENNYSGPCDVRLVKVFGAPPDQEVAFDKARNLFKLMEVHLVDRKWLATDTIPIAGVAGYGYIPHVPEGGVDLASYPYIRAWLVRIYAQPKIVSIATSPIPELARSK